MLENQNLQQTLESTNIEMIAKSQHPLTLTNTFDHQDILSTNMLHLRSSKDSTHARKRS